MGEGLQVPDHGLSKPRRGRQFHLKAGGDLDLAHPDAGLRQGIQGRGRVFILHRQVAGVQADPDMLQQTVVRLATRSSLTVPPGWGPPAEGASGGKSPPPPGSPPGGRRAPAPGPGGSVARAAALMCARDAVTRTRFRVICAQAVRIAGGDPGLIRQRGGGDGPLNPGRQQPPENLNQVQGVADPGFLPPVGGKNPGFDR